LALRILLDTHVAFWAVAARSKLPNHILEMIGDPASENWVSVVSIWEIGIKHALGRAGPNRMPLSATEALRDFDDAAFNILPVTARHVITVDELSDLHGDPFDRLLAAQAISEPLRIVTQDAILAAYCSNSILF
jgi:PIN domain nuclease of toxin-antitoxin system